MKTFTPRKLENKDSLFAFGTMSTVYWDFAELMSKQAKSEFESEFKPIKSFFVFPAIIFYCASFEALLNEGISRELLYKKDSEEKCVNIKDAKGDYKDLVKRIRAAAEILDRDKKGDVNENILNEFKALSELRNAIIHYNPHFGGIFQWSSKLISSFERSKVEAIEGDWTETFRRREILYWARETTENIIKVFLHFQRIEENEFFNVQ